MDGDVVVASGFCALDELTERLPAAGRSVARVEATGAVADSRTGIPGR